MSVDPRARRVGVLIMIGVVGGVLLWGQAVVSAQYGHREHVEKRKPMDRSSRVLAKEREAAHPKTVQQKLDKVMEQQSAILAQLAKVRDELQIVKIRATLR